MTTAIQATVWQAKDGKLFLTEAECLAYDDPNRQLAELCEHWYDHETNMDVDQDGTVAVIVEFINDHYGSIKAIMEK